jgi:hypothetical protein
MEYCRRRSLLLACWTMPVRWLTVAWFISLYKGCITKYIYSIQYIEFHSVCPLVGLGPPPPPPLTHASVPSPWKPKGGGGGGHIRLRRGGWGALISTTAEKAYFSLSTLWVKQKATNSFATSYLMGKINLPLPWQMCKQSGKALLTIVPNTALLIMREMPWGRSRGWTGTPRSSQWRHSPGLSSQTELESIRNPTENPQNSLN